MGGSSRLLLTWCLCFLAYRVALSLLLNPRVVIQQHKRQRQTLYPDSTAAPSQAHRWGDESLLRLQLSRFQLNKYNDTISSSASTLLQIPAINSMLFNRGSNTPIGNNNHNNNSSSSPHTSTNGTEGASLAGEANIIHVPPLSTEAPVDDSVISGSISYLTSNRYNSVEYLSKELTAMQRRLDKVEKAVVSGNSLRTAVGGSSGRNLNSVIDSLMFSTIQLNPKTVEVCATAGFFFIGALLGASLLDRLWLLGGIGLAYWASGAVYRDTRGGLICRRVGVQIAQFVRDLQEKYNQAIIFYRTGKLGYYTMSTWDKWDGRYGITPKFDEYKRLVMRRAMDFNTAFQDTQLTTQVQDVLNAITAAPREARKLDSKYGVTAKVVGFTRGVWSSSVKGLRSLLSAEGGAARANSETSGNNSGDDGGGGLASLFSGALSTSVERVRGFVRNKKKELLKTKPGYRGRLINPWTSPFDKVEVLTSKKKQSTNKKGGGWALM